MIWNGVEEGAMLFEMSVYSLYLVHSAHGCNGIERTIKCTIKSRAG